jgi:hypothetical protein
MGRQQQAGFRVGNSLNEADSPQYAIEGFQTVGAKLHDNIPASVGGVQRAYGRVSA